MSKAFTYLMIASLLLVITSFIKRNELPETTTIVESVNNEPIQVAVEEPPRSLSFKDVNYTIKPAYTYELYGLVVSYQHHDGDQMLHKLWNDHLNSADLCVIWGNNAINPHLSKIKFWNGQFTCNFKTHDEQAWQNFNLQQISNNHLISANPSIRKMIDKVNIGHQVRVRGWLSSYASEGGGERGTSITRTDTGNGACETILVEDFQIISPSNNPWRKSLKWSLLVFFIALAGYFVSPHKVY